MTRFNLTSEAQAGHAAPSAEPPFLFSSPAWCAWRAGQELARQGLPAPKGARLSRGYSVRLLTVSGAEILIAFQGQALDTLTLTHKS